MMTGVLAPDLPGNFFELLEIRQSPVFVVGALHDVEWNPNWIPSRVAEYDSFALGVALDDTRMDAGAAA